MNARQKAKQLKKELEVCRKLARKPKCIIPHIETVMMKHPINLDMCPDDFKASYIFETRKNIGMEIGNYLYENGWINMRTDFNDALNTDVLTAWISVVVDNYDD